MNNKLRISISEGTHVGRVRGHNEDNYCIILIPQLSPDEYSGYSFAPNEYALLCVADGMGGMEAGEVASQVAVDVIRESAITHFNNPDLTDVDINAALEKIMHQAHDQIVKTAKANPEDNGMGTTLTMACLHQDKVYLCWSGDSRAYLFDPMGIEAEGEYDLPKLKHLSLDHSFVWAKVMSGEMSAEEARTSSYSNVITQSLGDPKNRPQPDFAIFPLAPGQRILLCSDGLNSMVQDETIERILALPISGKQCVEQLIQAANDEGGADNITVIIAEIVAVPVSVEKVPARPQAITTKSDSSSPAPISQTSVTSRQRSLTYFFIIALLLACGLLLWYVINDVLAKRSASKSDSENLLMNAEHTNNSGVTYANSSDSLSSIKEKNTGLTEEWISLHKDSLSSDRVRVMGNVIYIRKQTEQMPQTSEVLKLRSTLNAIETRLLRNMDSNGLSAIEEDLNTVLQALNTLQSILISKTKPSDSLK